MNISQILTKLKALIYSKSETDSLLGGKANSSHTHTKSQITDFPSLATVATSGSYTDLSNKPTIPSKVSQLSNDSGFITSSGSCNYANYSGYVQGNNNSANAANALLRSGGGRSDSSPEGDTWIFLDEIGGASAPWGFKHNQEVNTIGFYGAGTETSSINLSNGHFSGTVDWSHVVNRPTNVSNFTNDSGFITSSGSCNYANSSGNADTLDGYHHDSFPKTSEALFTVNGLGSPGWSAIGTGTGGSCIQVKTTDNTYPSICFHRSGYSHCVLAESGGQLGTMQQGSETFNPLITSANIGSQNVNYANSAGSAGSVAWDNVSGRPWAVSQFSNDSGYITSSGSCNYANSSGNADTLDGSHAWQMQTLAAGGGVHGSNDWLMQCQHNVDGDGYFKLYCGDKSVGTKVDRASSAGYADSAGYANSAGSAGSVTWDNVSGRPWAVSQFSNDSGYITADGAAYPRRVGGVTMNFNWSGQGGQPTWLWGGEDGTNMYVYNPANFSVNYANSAGYANSSGYADSAGGVAWSNVSGRPWAVSQFTNDSGFITSAVDMLEIKGNPPYIDFHGSNSTQDYTSRIVDDGTASTGSLRLVTLFNSVHYQVELYKNYFEPTVDNDIYLGDSTNRWKNIFCATDSISTSDLRLKNTITDIDDSLLDAWENIEPKQYKFNDATEEKGDKARYHTGYLAQDIQAECEKQGVNASDYGLFCYDEWDEQEEVSEEIEKEKDGKIVKEKRIIQPKREKGDRYSLRYAEALVVECKYLRRENSRLKENLASIEERLEKLEKAENS